MPAYEILVCRQYAVTLVIEADSEEAAYDHANEGNWDDSNITRSELMDFTVEGITPASDG